MTNDSQTHTIEIQDPTAQAEGTTRKVAEASQVTEAILGTTIAPNIHIDYPVEADVEAYTLLQYHI